MLESAKAWKELMKLGLNVSKLRKDIDRFYRGNVIRIITEEGWIDYLDTPRSTYDIAGRFHYTDMRYLQFILDILVEDGTLVLVEGQGYKTNGSVTDDWVCPTCFDGAMEELWLDHAKGIPDRLRGKYTTFTGGMNLFNWDDALSNKLYEQIRRSAFQFSNALKNPCVFLDVGSGNGRGTAAIWSYYYERGHFGNGSKMALFGIEPDDNLNKIAAEEFVRMVTRRYSKNPPPPEVIRDHTPKFSQGYAESIPYEDDFFDVVYASQVLHWTHPDRAIKEMVRVTRPGGFIFGTQNFYPEANKYNDAHLKVVEGAHGLFHRDDIIRWVEQAGAKKIDIATPIAVFKISV